MDEYVIRPLTEEEVPLLEPLLAGLAQHHNRVARDFAGLYPTLPVASHITHMREHVREGTAYLVGLFVDGGETLAGFGMASAEGTYGEIDYLYVREDLRGGGRGGAILRDLLVYLRRVGATIIDIKAMDGNPARRFYEKHGFRLRSHVLAMQVPPEDQA